MKAELHEHDVLAIRFSDNEIAHSTFPDPLVTVDFSRDGKIVGIVFVGPRLQELKEALGVDSAVAEKAIDLYNGALQRAGVKIAPGAFEIMKRAILDEIAGA